MTVTMPNSLDLNGRPQDTRIVVAMSGCDDSSVPAALVTSETYAVFGITLQPYAHAAAARPQCPSLPGHARHPPHNSSTEGTNSRPATLPTYTDAFYIVGLFLLLCVPLLIFQKNVKHTKIITDAH